MLTTLCLCPYHQVPPRYFSPHYPKQLAGPAWNVFPVGGGSINATYLLITKDNGHWFCKVATEKKVSKGYLSRSTHNVGEPRPVGPRSQPGSHPVINDTSPFPDFLEKEWNGLERLRLQGICRIPAVVAHETSGGTQVLILEWIHQGPATGDFWSSFGEQLARLHRVSSASYGWEVDNYIGSLPQQNTHLPVPDSQSLPHHQHDQSQSPSHQHPTFQGQSPLQVHPPFTLWTDFFIQYRLEPQIRLASGKGLLPASALHQFERLYTALPAIFPEEAPSLLHGDNCLPSRVAEI